MMQHIVIQCCYLFKNPNYQSEWTSSVSPTSHRHRWELLSCTASVTRHHHVDVLITHISIYFLLFLSLLLWPASPCFPASRHSQLLCDATEWLACWMKHRTQSSSHTRFGKPTADGLSGPSVPNAVCWWFWVSSLPYDVLKSQHVWYCVAVSKQTQNTRPWLLISLQSVCSMEPHMYLMASVCLKNHVWEQQQRQFERWIPATVNVQPVPQSRLACLTFLCTQTKNKLPSRQNCGLAKSSLFAWLLKDTRPKAVYWTGHQESHYSHHKPLTIGKRKTWKFVVMMDGCDAKIICFIL